MCPDEVPSAAAIGGGAHVAPIGAALLDDPLAFLAAEHARQTVLLGHLERVARDPQSRAARDLAAALLHWLTHELPIHVADEVRSLYPRLAGFDADGTIERLRAEHRRDQDMATRLVAGLRRAAEGRLPDPGFAAEAQEFAAGHRAHLALEERTLAPLAHRCHAPEELASLAAEMGERRGRDGR
jgi:hypothetical protein